MITDPLNVNTISHCYTSQFKTFKIYLMIFGIYKKMQETI